MEGSILSARVDCIIQISEKTFFGLPLGIQMGTMR